MSNQKNKDHPTRGAAPSKAEGHVTSIAPPTASVRARQAAGRSLAELTPLKEHAAWRVALRQHDPIDNLIGSSKGRIRAQELTLAPAGAICGAAADRPA